jgi:hypothetical protein
MGIVNRYRKQQESEQNKGKPLGGGLDPRPTPTTGSAALFDLQVKKPVEQEGKKGLEVSYRVQLSRLGGLKLVLETTLHEQDHGPFKSRLATMADSVGLLNVWEIFKPADDDETVTDRRVFIPFEAIEVERTGKLWCFARVKVLEADRGTLAQAEEAFAIEAG